MSDELLNDPVIQEMRRTLDLSRAAFIAETNRALTTVKAFAESVSGAIGEVSIDEAKDALVRRFAQALGMPTLPCYCPTCGTHHALPATVDAHASLPNLPSASPTYQPPTPDPEEPQ